MAVFRYLNENGQWDSVDMPGALKYTPQVLTDDQKDQVKQNIGLDNVVVSNAMPTEIITSATQPTPVEGKTIIWIDTSLLG